MGLRPPRERYPAVVTGAIWSLVTALAVGLSVFALGQLSAALDRKDERLRALELAVDRLEYQRQMDRSARRSH